MRFEMINLSANLEVVMLGRRRVNVEIGDVFVEELPSKRSIFRALGGAESTPSDSFLNHWEVSQFLHFNDLPHAKLTHAESGRQRVIACDALARQEIYKKQN